MRFLYLRDPLFLGCVFLYWLNQSFLKLHLADAFFHNYIYDLICVPLLVPVGIYLARIFGFRPDDQPPQINEVLLPLLVWYVTIQYVFPQSRDWSPWVLGGSHDVAWYCVGAVGASVWWWIAYMPTAEKSSAPKLQQ